LIANDGVRIMTALLDIVHTCLIKDDLMRILVPTIDGILFDNPKNLNIFRRIEDKDAYRTFSNVLIEKNLH
jgi:hypothetical protein